MLAGLLATAYLFKSGFGVGNYANPALAATPPSGVIVTLQTALNLGWIATCIFLLGRKRDRNQPLAPFLLVLSLLFLGGKIAMTGGKQAFLEPLVEALIVYHYARRRMGLGKLVAIAVPGILLAFGLINFYRFSVVGHSGAPTSIGEVGNRVSSAVDRIGSGSTGERESAFEQMMNRQTGVDALAVVIKVTPHSQPFRYGQPWVDTFIYSVIPRFIWPTKPTYSASYDFEQNYLGMPSYYIGFSSLHLISDLYRNFYLFGVAGGMFLLGLISKTLYLICGPTASRGGFGLMLYAAVLPNLFHYMEGDVGTAFSGCARLVVLALAVAYFLGVRRLKRPARMSFRILSGNRKANRSAIPRPFGGQITVPRIL
jgi:hypothetical protein